jgi:hypothetical protein
MIGYTSLRMTGALDFKKEEDANRDCPFPRGHQPQAYGAGRTRTKGQEMEETRKQRGRKRNLIITITENQIRAGWNKQNVTYIITVCK